MSKSKQNQPRPESSQSAEKKASASRREQLRAQQAAEAARTRTRRIMIAIAAALAAVIAITVIVVLVQRNQPAPTAPSVTPAAEQVVPPNATDDNTAIRYVAKTDPKPDAIEVVAYLDFQCPGCGQASQLIDPKLEALADAGEITLAYHMLHGLDRGYPGQHSFRAAIAATCSDQYGVFTDYSRLIFANQPAREGDGWTDEELITWAGQSGISGTDLETFTSCFTGQATSDFVTGMQDSRPAIVAATPSFVVNGKLAQFTGADIASEQALLTAIQRTAA